MHLLKGLELLTAQGTLKWVYKTLRSIIFSVTLLVVGLYVLVYSLLSLPAFTNWVKGIAVAQLSEFLGGRVEIEALSFIPFNEVKIRGLAVYDPNGEKCVEIKSLGAGIRLWKLLTEQKIELTYGEIIELDAILAQKEKSGPLNIDFILKAFSSEEKKEKKPFDLALRNVVLRKSRVSFIREWASGEHLGSLDLSNLEIEDLAADITFPKISDKGVKVDLRRLSLKIPGTTQIEKIGFVGEFSDKKLSLEDFEILLPSSRLFIPSLTLEASEPGKFKEALFRENHVLTISDSYITPADFEFLSPIVKDFTEKISLSLQAQGNIEEVRLDQFELNNPEVISLSFSGALEGLENISDAKGDVKNFYLYVDETTFRRLQLSDIKLPPLVATLLNKLGFIEISGDFSGSMKDSAFATNLEAASSLFRMTFEGEMQKKGKNSFNGEGELNLEDVLLHEILPQVPVSHINANLITQMELNDGKPEGMVSLMVEDLEYKGTKYDGFSLNVSKEDNFFDGDFLMHNVLADIESKFSGDMESEEKSVAIDMDINRLDLSEIVDMKAYDGYVLSGSLNLDGKSRGINDFEGELTANKFKFISPDGNKKLQLNRLKINAEKEDSLRSVEVQSDWLDFRAEGPYRLKEIPAQLQALAQSVFPAMLKKEEHSPQTFSSDMAFDLVIKKNNSLTEFFNLPVKLLVPITVSGLIEGSRNTASLTIDVPYLQQGKDKLIYDSKFLADINGDTGELNARIETNVPVKRGDLALTLNIFGHDDEVSTDVRWINTENSDFKAHLILDTKLGINPFTRKPDINVHILPSVLQMGTANWNVAECNINYTDKDITIDRLRIWHNDQFVEVKGTASPKFDDVVQISLADIDVDYVFDMLQINYVTFGGVATGEITGHSLLSGNPVAQTESLVIKNFTYNGAPLGECRAASKWNNAQKEIEIFADIFHRGHQIVDGAGGIWIGKDSLSFNINADKVPVEFVQPFMAVFSSHVGGFASGNVNLFGTFHDIDMTGKIFADSVAVKLDYTNTIYHGSDSVFLHPGKIDIPHFRLYDKFGNSALLTGELTHRYFHDPSFIFKLSDAQNFMCYDTNSDLNPDWYGTLFGTGSALLKGTPGITDISADMTVSGNSIFTFVLNDTQYARDYQFLTFSDRQEEERKKNMPPTTNDIKEMLRQRMKHEIEANNLSKFGIDIRATVTPQVLFTLVMDPATGDKITARGQGAMQVKYESDNDEMSMYGKYEILEGNYNFSLQDIILRDFKIKEGSYIAFNGDPLRADLDISATYRVNTNLSDLDKSFSTDRDLNRTNVPVDAVLSVTGNMTSPDITFDIELPTLTQDVERKVKSIISTDDMMNRQIIYLLALNRFYTPEYMGASGNGGELAAVASSTISSQLSNMLGQLTDKFSLSPSFRSDKGDFSDIEVDVALSSRLLNNRLLINGNFGYRDKSTSSTTFVGDFDVEYLLSKNGNLRLKAYNHFNDQNYYLREALTTQGLGVVYRRDFDDWFTFLKKKKRK